MATTKITSTEKPLEEKLIRDLIEEYPDLMPLLASYGLDLCCGGHSLAEAAELHGLDIELVAEEVSRAIEVAAG